MKTICDKCGTQFEVSAEYINTITICPNCNQETFVKEDARNASLRRQREQAARHAEFMKQQTASPSTGNDALCFFLGLLFGIVGILVAAIIAKREGTVAALKGLAVHILVGAAVALIL